MQRNLHISKSQYETALERRQQIELECTLTDRDYFFGEPDFAYMGQLGLHNEYIELQTTISNYLYYNATKKSVTGAKNKYFITFTHNNDTPKDAFKTAVIKQLERKTFTTIEYTFEHEETNIHCHAIVESKHTLNNTNFKSHSIKHGYVQVKIIKTDNGLSDYINKENPSILPDS